MHRDTPCRSSTGRSVGRALVSCVVAVCVTIILLAGALVRPSFAGTTDREFAPVFYELREGSVLVDDCIDCDRATIEIPVRGSFVLTRLAVRIIGSFYALTELDVRGSDGTPVAIRGSGSYHRITDELARFSLEVDIDREGGALSGIGLQSGEVVPEAQWPEIDALASESLDIIRDPLHVYRLRIVAAPRADAVLYELLEGDPRDFSGSFFFDECTICGRPTIPVPVGGRFLLVPAQVGGPNPIDTYRVAALDVATVILEPPFSPPVYHIQGVGTYAAGGEVARLQEMELAVRVGNDADEAIEAFLRSGRVAFPEGVRFPTIDITASGPNPESEILVFTLHLVARPTEEPSARFVRGDCNGDGRINLTDAVEDLRYCFGDASVPCAAACDADADGSPCTGVTDAVLVLTYLFGDGAPPPPPFPECGTVEGEVDCEIAPLSCR